MLRVNTDNATTLNKKFAAVVVEESTSKENLGSKVAAVEDKNEERTEESCSPEPANVVLYYEEERLETDVYEEDTVEDILNFFKAEAVIPPGKCQVTINGQKVENNQPVSNCPPGDWMVSCAANHKRQWRGPKAESTKKQKTKKQKTKEQGETFEQGGSDDEESRDNQGASKEHTGDAVAEEIVYVSLGNEDKDATCVKISPSATIADLKEAITSVEKIKGVYLPTSAFSALKGRDVGDFRIFPFFEGAVSVGRTVETCIKNYDFAEGAKPWIIVTDDQLARGMDEAEKPMKRSVSDEFRGNFDCMLKSDFSKVHIFSDPTFRLLGREQVLGRIAGELVRREVMNPINSNEKRQACRHICLQAFPGGGKSRIIDHLCQIKGSLMDFVEGEKVDTLRQALNDDTVYVPIQFRGYSKGAVFDESYLDKKLILEPEKQVAITAAYSLKCAEIQVAARLMYSYCIQEGVTFVTFLNKFKKDYSHITVGEACRIILKMSGKSRIIVLVDEISKTNGDLDDILTQIGFVLDEKYGYTILTSLDIKPVEFSTTRSQRNVVWFPLKPLEFSLARSLFVPEYENLPFLDYLITDCGGSPRALECLSIVLKSKDWPEEYTSLLIKLKAKFREFGYKMPITLSMVSAALLNRPVHPSQVLEGCDCNCEELVARGGFFNTFIPEDESFVPVISSLHLSVFAHECLLRTEPILKAIGKTLSSLLVYADKTSEDMPGPGFEKTFGLWETLVRLLHQAQGHKFLLIGDLYPLCTKSSFELLNFVLGDDPFQFSDEKEKKEAEKNNVFYHYGGNNPGFDLLCRTTCFEEEHEKDNPFQAVFCYDTRYSQPDSKTKEGLADLKKKYSLTLKNNFNDKLFFVYVLRRDATSDLTNEEMVDRNDCLVPGKLPKNCIVLDRQSLRKSFGPSLSDRLFLKL